MAKLATQINPKAIFALFCVWIVFGLWLASPIAFAAGRENDVVRAVRKAGPAVVNISSQYEIRKKSNPFSDYGIDPRLEQFFNDFFSPELQRREKRSSLGSGVIIDGLRGFVLTNTHVIQNATAIGITLSDKREFAASIVGMDPDSDLAVLKIETEEHLPAIQLGDSQDLMIGESVIAIGNPFGFSNTVTTGVISAVKRSVKTADRVFHEFIQTDASINPGNSGGPLLNIDGELIGINTAIYAQAQGIGFAIPINRARRIVADLIAYGTVVPAWIGISVQPINARLAEYLRLESDQFIFVASVEKESPASSGGVVEGDIIVKLNGEPVPSIQHYRAAMKKVAVNQTLLLEMIRNGTRQQISIQTAAFPKERALSIAWNRLGIRVTELTRKNRARFGLRAQKGVVVVDMRPDAHLFRIGVRPGDIIRQMDDAPIETLSNFKTAMVQSRMRRSVVLLLQRDGNLYHINAIMKD